MATPVDPTILCRQAEEVSLAVKACAEKAGHVTRLLPVSKTRPVEDLQTLYSAGYRTFGENYVQELISKAAIMPEDTQFHLIGHLQSGNVARLIREVPTLTCVETLDSEKLATKLNHALETTGRSTPLKVLIQVKTSEEETKSGVNPEEALPLVTFIRNNCPHLQFTGFMTIGAPGDFECFDRLVAVRADVAEKLGVDPKEWELSMGMSADFEEAIKRGSTSVRVGSTIFGARHYPTA